MSRFSGNTVKNSNLFGPFSVSPDQVVALGPDEFTLFVNRLLAVETAIAGIVGTSLTTTYRNSVADGGVDAGLNRAESTRWIPSGDSAWQFKSGDIGPAKCRSELKSATAALDVLKSGGAYRLVVGVSLTAKQVKNRRDALIDQARVLGIGLNADSIEVLGADALARWSEEHPSLAVSPLLGGIDHVALSFDRWSDSNRQETVWVDADSRQAFICQIQELIESRENLDFTVRGASGVGKSRTVMEALRGDSTEPLVLYVNAADSLRPTMINQLLAQDRVAVLVVDQCGTRQHESLAEVIPKGSNLRLITIGEPDGRQPRSPVLVLPPLESTAVDELLKVNQPALWAEGRRLVCEMAGGNAGYALVLAHAILNQPDARASELITADAIRTYVTQSLPTGTTLLACHALALFTRVGYEGDLANELSVVSDALGVPLVEFKSAAQALNTVGLLGSQGRYRSVVPHPLAVFLASGGWDEFGAEILEKLLPDITAEMAERLFTRAGEIGTFGATHKAVTRILSGDGKFASLDSLSEGSNSRLLTQFAIVAPAETCDRLTSLIEGASDDDLLAARTIRRDLVWTLEKLVWHTGTFESAADALLRLAVVETEDWANNATGTWVDLFGVMLPGTAARPSVRASYLARVSTAEDSRRRLLAVSASAKALTGHESIMVSGEVQGGVLVEARGTPSTYGEVWEYQNSALDVLGRLAVDPEVDVSDSAIKALVAAIHPLLEIEPLREHLVAVLGSLPSDGIRQVHTQIAHLSALFERVDNADGRRAGVKSLQALLPSLSPSEELSALAHSQRYDFEDGELLSQFVETAKRIPSGFGVQALLDLLTTPLPAAFEVGRALADITGRDPNVLTALMRHGQAENLPALVGYLWGLVELGDTNAFDGLLDGPEGADLPPITRLRIAVRGPRSQVGWKRVLAVADQLPVSEGAHNLFGWHTELRVDQIGSLLNSWLPRISSQADFNAAVDFIALALHKKPDWMEAIDPLVAELVDRRERFPALGQQSWEWVQLARRQTTDRPNELLSMLIRQIVNGSLDAAHGEESLLLRDAVRQSGTEGWCRVAEEILDGPYQMKWAFAGWFTGLVDADVVKDWIGTNSERAKAIASISPVVGSDGSMDPVARMLLTEYGTESNIGSILYGSFVSGTWSGKDSDRLLSKIEQLERWQQEPTTSDGVRGWTREVATSLRSERAQALAREAEGDW